MINYNQKKSNQGYIFEYIRGILLLFWPVCMHVHILAFIKIKSVRTSKDVPKLGTSFLLPAERERRRHMDFKKILTDYFGIALAVVIGVAVVVMYSAFMAEGGLIQGFTQDLLNLVIEKVKAMIQ